MSLLALLGRVLFAIYVAGVGAACTAIIWAGVYLAVREILGVDQWPKVSP